MRSDRRALARPPRSSGSLAAGCERLARPEGARPERFAGVRRQDAAAATAQSAFCERSYPAGGEGARRYAAPPLRPLPGASGDGRRRRRERRLDVGEPLGHLVRAVRRGDGAARRAGATASRETACRWGSSSSASTRPSEGRTSPRGARRGCPARSAGSAREQDLGPLLDSLGVERDAMIPIHALVDAVGLAPLRAGRRDPRAGLRGGEGVPRALACDLSPRCRCAPARRSSAPQPHASPSKTRLLRKTAPRDTAPRTSHDDRGGHVAEHVHEVRVPGGHRQPPARRPAPGLVGERVLGARGRHLAEPDGPPLLRRGRDRARGVRRPRGRAGAEDHRRLAGGLVRAAPEHRDAPPHDPEEPEPPAARGAPRDRRAAPRRGGRGARGAPPRRRPPPRRPPPARASSTSSAPSAA